MDFYDQICSSDLIADWNAIRLVSREKHELDRIQRIVCSVCFNQIEMFDAGKQVEKLNAAQTEVFRTFLLKFVFLYQNLPENRKSFANVMFYLKMINLNAENPENPVDFSEIEDLTPIMEMAGNILIKDFLENARNLYPDDGKLRKISARDLLDAVVMSDESESLKFKENAFLTLKEKLINLCGETVSDFEKKLFVDEKSGITMFPKLFGQSEKSEFS